MNVKADPAKLRELASKLKSTGQQLEQLQRQAMGALQASDWDDRERQRFESDLRTDMKAISAIGRKLQAEYPRASSR